VFAVRRGRQSLPAPPNKEGLGPAPPRYRLLYPSLADLQYSEQAPQAPEIKIVRTMPRARKINREKVLASLDKVCPNGPRTYFLASRLNA
jgi:hypothetical protein